MPLTRGLSLFMKKSLKESPMQKAWELAIECIKMRGYELHAFLIVVSRLKEATVGFLLF